MEDEQRPGALHAERNPSGVVEWGADNGETACLTSGCAGIPLKERCFPP